MIATVLWKNFYTLVEHQRHCHKVTVLITVPGVDLDQFHLFQGTTQTFSKKVKYKTKYSFLYSLIVHVSNVFMFYAFIIYFNVFVLSKFNFKIWERYKPDTKNTFLGRVPREF